MGRKLWETLADVLQLMTQQACPDAFYQGDGITQLTQTAAFLQGRETTRSQQLRFVQSGSGRVLHIRGQRPIFIGLQHHGQMVSRQKSSACRHILHRPLSKSSLTPGTPGQKQTKGSKLGIHLKDIPQLISAVLLLNYFVVWAHHAVQHYATSLLRWRSNVGTARTLVFSSITNFINIHHTSTPYILPPDMWTTEFHFFPNSFFRFHLSNNSPPHLFTSRRFSLKLNQHFPWFRGGPQPAYSHAPVPTYHGRHHPPQICHATAQTLRSSFQARTRLINPVTHPHAATFSAIRAMRAQHLPGSRLHSQL